MQLIFLTDNINLPCFNVWKSTTCTYIYKRNRNTDDKKKSFVSFAAIFLIFLKVCFPPGAKAMGTQNGYHVRIQGETTGNTTGSQRGDAMGGSPPGAPGPWDFSATGWRERGRPGKDLATPGKLTTGGPRPRLTWNCWLKTKWQLAGFYVHMTTS